MIALFSQEMLWLFMGGSSRRPRKVILGGRQSVPTRTRFPRALRGPRRQTNWTKSADQGYVAVGADASVLQQSFAGTGGEEVTIVRTRGVLSIVPAVFTADIEIVGAMGMGIVSQQAFVAGAGSIPAPYTDANWEGWFVHQFFSYRFEFITGAGVILIDHKDTIDSKAMRKLKDDDVIVVMVESQAAAMRASYQFRMLFKLA